jgi:hypothetical protein
MTLQEPSGIRISSVLTSAASIYEGNLRVLKLLSYHALQTLLLQTLVDFAVPPEKFVSEHWKIHAVITTRPLIVLWRASHSGLTAGSCRIILSMNIF